MAGFWWRNRWRQQSDGGARSSAGQLLRALQCTRLCWVFAAVAVIKFQLACMVVDVGNEHVEVAVNQACVVDLWLCSS
jgi:hypothetical protein